MKVLVPNLTLYNLFKDHFSSITGSLHPYRDFDVIIEDFDVVKKAKEWQSKIDVNSNLDKPLENLLTLYKKKLGSVLINFIDIYENEIDAITSIFENNANAVIYTKNNNYKFVDALGNVWYEGLEENELADAIKTHYLWSSSAKRVKSQPITEPHLEQDVFFDKEEFSLGKSGRFGWNYGRYGYFYETTFLVPQIEKFIELNKQVADKFELIKGRYFGNCSTRCSEMFPTANLGDFVLVSKRNVPKARLSPSEMVVVKFDHNVEYYGENKPSVDTPIQCEIYKLKPEIKYMIHGHTYIDGAVMTDNYYPCGDMREVDEVLNKIVDNSGVLNLRNHGFLIYANSIEKLEELINNSSFIEREVGFEKVTITFRR